MTAARVVVSVCALGRLHVLAADPSTGGAAGSRAEEAEKSRRWVQGPSARLGLLRRALDAAAEPVTLPAGVKAPAPRKGPRHDTAPGPEPGPARPPSSPGVCARPVISQVTDLDTGEVRSVPISCGSTREDRCPRVRGAGAAAADAAVPRGLAPRHRTRPTRPTTTRTTRTRATSYDATTATRRVRSTRRRQDAPDLPRVPVEDRTVGRVFTAPDGKTYRPSMFVTLTLGSYGRVTARASRSTPARYDYRRAALDALHFPKLVDRFWQNLRRCAGYRVQYFAAVEAQRRLAPHLHAAIRGAIPRGAAPGAGRHLPPGVVAGP